MRNYTLYSLYLIVLICLTPSLSFGMQWWSKNAATPTSSEEGEGAVVDVLAGGRASGTLSDSSFVSMGASGSHHIPPIHIDNEQDEESERSASSDINNPDNQTTKKTSSALTTVATMWAAIKQAATPTTKKLSYAAMATGALGAAWGIRQMVRNGESPLSREGGMVALGTSVTVIGIGSICYDTHLDNKNKRLME